MTSATRSRSKSLATLRAIRNIFDPEAEKTKRALVALLMADPPTSAKALLSLHDDLLFLRAFPGGTATLRDANRALSKFESLVSSLPKREAILLDDTGVAGSTTRHIQSYPIVQWLAARAKGEASLDWRHYDHPSRLDDVLRIILLPSEREAFENRELSTQDWIERAISRNFAGALEWIVDALAASPKSDAADDCWDGAEPPICWRLSSSRWSVTHNKLADAGHFLS